MRRSLSTAVKLKAGGQATCKEDWEDAGTTVSWWPTAIYINGEHGEENWVGWENALDEDRTSACKRR